MSNKYIHKNIGNEILDLVEKFLDKNVVRLEAQQHSHCLYIEFSDPSFSSLFQELINKLGYSFKKYDTAYLITTTDSVAKDHDDKGEVYIMLTSAKVEVGDSIVDVEKGDVVNIPKNTMHAVHTTGSRYLLINVVY